MEITINNRYGLELVFKAENVEVVEDLEERIYGLTAEGKTDFNIVRRDVKTEYLEKIVSVLDDMIDYRTSDFDSSSLIERLFDKLPTEVATNLLNKLKRDYDEE